MSDQANMSRPPVVESNWSVDPVSYETVSMLARELGLSETVASILARRGIDSAEQARDFLEADQRHDPAALPGVAAAIETIAAHLDRGTTIAVHGDYDADGICSTALLTDSLRGLGGDVMARLPNRDDGYGLSIATIDQLAQLGAGLLITVDCGIGALDEIRHAQRLGLDVVVTDHHKPQDALPDCPVVHPGLGDYPTPALCATAVAFKLSQALYGHLGRDPRLLDEQLDLVGLATVTDVMPLTGENRTLVKDGLRCLAGGGRPGLAALLRVVGVDPQSASEHTLGFVIGPRINAAGRLYRPDAALELMLTRDDERALEIARELDAINRERQDVETRILFEAEKQLNESGRASDPALVLAGRGWHAGVVGIVASRFVERYSRPCVVIAIDEQGRGKGSARSIPAYDLHGGLEACAEQLERFGGHRAAAGLEIEESRIDTFREALCANARASLEPRDFVKVARIDAVVPGDVVGMKLVEEIESLRPFGMGNPAVNLLIPAATITDLQPMGEGRHARFTATSGGARSRVVAFGSGSSADALGISGERRFDVVARLERNEWQGATEPRLVMQSLSAVEPSASGTLRTCGCHSSDGWLERMWRAYDEVFDRLPTDRPAAVRTAINRRGEGVFGSLGAVLSAGESTLIVCADAGRRRAVLERELGPHRFCNDRAGLALFDYACLLRDVSQAEQFQHLFLLDPPSSAEPLAQLAGTGARGYLHQGWGDAEVAFAVAKHTAEYELRDSMRVIYASLRESGSAADASLAAVLMGDAGRPRSPTSAARCLRVLAELDLIGLERSSATVRCTITEGSGKARLESSATYATAARVHQEGLRYLSGLTSQRSAKQAA